MSQEFILSGRLARDPEIRSTLAGQPVANLRLLQTRGYRKGDNWVEAVEGFDLVTFNEALITRVIQPYCTKGKRLRIRGRLQTRSSSYYLILHVHTLNEFIFILYSKYPIF